MQARLRHEIQQKKAEKESSKLIEAILWGAPRGGKTLDVVKFYARCMADYVTSGCSCSGRVLAGQL